MVILRGFDCQSFFSLVGQAVGNGNARLSQWLIDAAAPEELGTLLEAADDEGEVGAATFWRHLEGILDRRDGILMTRLMRAVVLPSHLDELF